MSKCLLCKSNFRRQINYEIIFSFVKSKEKYACSDCLQKFVKKKGIVCSGCNKEINKKTIDMKNFLLALMVVLTTCTLAVAQTTVVRDSIGKVKVTVTKDNKANTNNTAVTVIGVDTADADSADVNANSSNVSTTHGKASFTFDSDDSDFPFHNVSAGGGILVAIIAIIAVFGFPVFILFVIFFFRYKNRKARYRLAEQSLAAGQPLPAEFIRENKNDFIDLEVTTDEQTTGTEA